MQPRHCRMVGYQGYQGCKPVSMRVSLIPRQRFMGYQGYQARAGFRLAHFQICPMAYPRKPRKPQLLGQTCVACHILTGLERGGKVQLTQTEMDAIEAAAQARADKRGTSLEAERSKLMQSMKASRSESTKAAYEARIDALFAGQPASRAGVRVLDRADVLDLLGFGDMSVVLREGKVILGQDNHPRMTADVWKKVPQWLDSPAAVFDSDTVPGALVAIGPELVDGNPVRITLEPNRKQNTLDVHLLTNAYDAGGKTPWLRWSHEGLARYLDKKTFPAILAPSGLQLPRVEQIMRGTGKILTEKNLAGYRRQQGDAPSFSRAATLITYY